MTDIKTAARMALEALERCVATCFDRYAHEQVMSRPEHFVNQAITALRQALEQPQDEWLTGCPECGMDGECGCDKQPAQQEPFGHVTVRRLSQRFENHHDQYHFYPAGQSPYLDNVDECHAVYTSPQPAQQQEWRGPVDWEAVAADQAMTIAMMKAEHKPWVGLTPEEREMHIRYGSTLEDIAISIEAKLKEKNT